MFFLYIKSQKKKSKNEKSETISALLFRFNKWAKKVFLAEEITAQEEPLAK